MMQDRTNGPEIHRFVIFLLAASRQLMECGCSANRIEALVQKLGISWGFEVEVLAIPTGVWISVRRGKEYCVELTRVRNWSVDLDRLARLNDVVDGIYDHRISLDVAEARLKEVSETRPPYSTSLTLLAGGCASVVLIYLYKGTPLEMGLAFPLGALVQLLHKYLMNNEHRRYLADFLSGAVVALFAWTCGKVVPGVDTAMLIVAGIIVLVPGLVLVNAIHEIAQRNLVSGTAKMMEATIIGISLTFGIVSVLGLLGT